MSTPVSAMRPLLRPSFAPARLAVRRATPRRLQSSSTTEAAAKARQAATEVASKAAEGLSRVAAAAGPIAAGAAKNLTTALGNAGGRTGKLVAFAERYTPFVVYYSRVGLELGRLVFQSQKMSPPSVATFQTYYQNALKRLQIPGQLPSPTALLQQARTLSKAQLAVGGVIAAECLGFFTVGEIIGRFKLIGYRGGAPPSAH